MLHIITHKWWKVWFPNTCGCGWYFSHCRCKTCMPDMSMCCDGTVQHNGPFLFYYDITLYNPGSGKRSVQCKDFLAETWNVIWHLEASIIFGDFVCKVDLFSLGQELPELGPIVHAEVISHKVPVYAVSPPLLPVQQQVRSWRKKQK